MLCWISSDLRNCGFAQICNPSFFTWSPMIIAFASSKGGVGKSTTCAAIGSRLALRGEQVLIFDLDQNQTLERWGRRANIPGLTVRAIDRDGFTTMFRETTAAGDTDHILI